MQGHWKMCMTRTADLLREAAIGGRGGALACAFCRARRCLQCGLCRMPASLLRGSLLRCAEPLAAREHRSIPLQEEQTGIMIMQDALMCGVSEMGCPFTLPEAKVRVWPHKQYLLISKIYDD